MHYISAMARKITIVFTTDEDLKLRLDEVADLARVSRSWLLTTILSAWAASLGTADDHAVHGAIAATLNLANEARP